MVKKTTVGLAGALAIAVPFIAIHEGKRNDPYYDIAHVKTVCYGETNVEMRHYTNEECTAMLSKAIDKYAVGVLNITPTLINKPHALAAATSLTYNIGIGNYKKSTAAKRFNKGDIEGGCNAITRWNQARVNGKMRLVKGLATRRYDEFQICIKDI